MTRPASERVAAIEKLISEGEDIQVLIADLASKIWDHTPFFPECERPIDNATNGVDNLVEFLEDQKKAAIAEGESDAQG